MKKVSMVVAVLVAMVFSFGVSSAQNKFIGSKNCGMCHKAGKGGDAFVVWEKSEHAKAYQTLLGENAKKIAKEKGLKTAPHETPECLSCHVTGGGAAKNVEASFKIEEGVGCEACHGAGSAFKVVHSKGDKAKSKESGLVLPEANEKLCVTCHNSKSPTFKSFKFEDSWAKIAHKLPKK